MTEHAEPTDADEAITEAVAGHQPTLPTLELPDYHGRIPVAMKTKLTGAAMKVTKAHTVGDRVVIVIEGKVKAAGHEDTDDGLIYVETTKVLDMFELDGPKGSRLLSTLRSLYRTAADAVKGRVAVPQLGDVGYADGSGVVLTPKELAELRGDPTRAILSDELTPAVVVYSDGLREMWPDEFDQDCPRPRVGDVFENTTTGLKVTVEKLLDHVTGELLGGPTAPPELPTAPGDVRTTTGETVESPDVDADDEDDDDDFDGDLGDDVAEEWEDPERPKAASVEELVAEVGVPDDDDFAFVDCPLEELRERLDALDDIARVKRLLIAEKGGRRRDAKPRFGAINLLESRIAFLADTDGGK